MTTKQNTTKISTNFQFINALYVIMFFLTLTYKANPKQIQSNIQMGQLKQTEGWLFLGKMALRIGNAEIKITTEKVSGTPKNSGGQLVINLISDMDWKVQSQKKCQNSIKPPILAHQLLLEGSLSISEHTVNITQNQLYYFVLKDCGKKFETDYTNPELFFKLKMQIINDGAYMGDQQDHWYIIPVIISVGLWLIMSDKYFLRGQFQRDPDYAKMILFGAIATNISSLMWRSFGYLIYRNFGSNYLLFHIIYLFMHSVSQTMVLSLLVLVSMGWSLNYLQGPQLDIAIPIISFIAVMNIILTLMTQISNSSHDMHHTFDAYTGSILIIVRLVLSIGFLISVLVTIKNSRYRIRQFMKIFGLLGIMYILSMPLIVSIANSSISTRHRNQFVFICVELIKSVCNILMMYMVSSSRSQYNKLCYKNASFLPSETGLF